MAKAVLDNRMIDLPFSQPFFKWMLQVLFLSLPVSLYIFLSFILCFPPAFRVSLFFLCLSLLSLSISSFSVCLFVILLLLCLSLLNDLYLLFLKHCIENFVFFICRIINLSCQYFYLSIIPFSICLYLSI